jgi:hypothetical protein
MRANAEAYWSNAAAGNLEEAAKYREAFDADHPRSTRAMSFMGAAVLLLLVCTAWSSARVERANG